MKMERFRIENYKKIEDTGWVEIGNIISLVGKNEAGKSAILRGLSKLNPSDDSGYEYSKEFPRHRLDSDHNSEDWRVSSAEFTIDKEKELPKLIKIAPLLSNITTIIVSRYYDNKCLVSYGNSNITKFKLTDEQFVEILEDWKRVIETTTSVEERSDELQSIKNNLSDVINSKIESIQSSSNHIPIETITNIFNELNTHISKEWQNTFKRITNKYNSLINKFKINHELDSAFVWVMDNMPKFIYFDKYDILNSAMPINEFINGVESIERDPQLRIRKCLFEHGGLNINTIKKLTSDVDETTDQSILSCNRNVIMTKASKKVTESFSLWWKQRKYKIRYDLNGDYFRVWVSDDLYDTEIELEQRSAGLQYFFSFYLIFIVEADKNHENSILLLDEPGLHSHISAQQKTVEFLNKLSEKNQILYTTHSPFMIDKDNFKNIRIVSEDKDNHGTTKISDNLCLNDKDSLFPLQAALGYSLAQTLFYSEYQFVVEGITDLNILIAMQKLLAKKSMTTLNNKIVIIPAGGTRRAKPLGSMLIGHGIKFVILFDGDKAGTNTLKLMEDKLTVKGVTTNLFTKKKESEIEDFFDESTYVKAVKKAYPNSKIKFNEQEKKIESIVRQIESVFKRKNYGVLEKKKVCDVLLDCIEGKIPEIKISDNTCEKFEALFIKINEILDLK